MRALAVFGLVASAGVVACALSSNNASSESDILSGRESERREVVLLGDGASGCSGTLIAPDVVATAAHCSDYRVVVVGYSKRTTNREETIGDPGPDDRWRKYQVAERVDMPGFVYSGCPMTGAADVALLRLTEPVTDTPFATLADHAPDTGQECVVAGYGRHAVNEDHATVEGENNDWTYGERREARVTIFEKGGRGAPVVGAVDAGESDAGGVPPPVAGNIDWFSARGIDGAHSLGDSGGAIFCGDKLAGIVSCSVDRNRPVLDLVKVYGNIEAARAFIDETMRKWRENPLLPVDAGTDAGADISDAADDG